MQILHLAEALGVREKKDIVSQRDVTTIDSSGGVNLEPDVCRRRCRAVGQHNGADLTMFMTVGIDISRLGVASADRYHASGGQALQLAPIADAVTVDVAPDLQSGVGRVLGVDHAVAVVIVFGQGLIAVPSGGSIAQQAVVAEQFAAITDTAVAIAVMHQQTVIRTDPAGPFAQAIVIQIEMARADCQCLYAIAVQVKDDRRSAAFGIIRLRSLVLLVLLVVVLIVVQLQENTEVGVVEPVDGQTTIDSQDIVVEYIGITATVIGIDRVFFLALAPGQSSIAEIDASTAISVEDDVGSISLVNIKASTTVKSVNA